MKKEDVNAKKAEENVLVKDKIVEEVREDLLRRSKIGIEKYGVTLDQAGESLLGWLQHAYEECLDQANYLKAAIIKLNENKNK